MNRWLPVSIALSILAIATAAPARGDVRLNEGQEFIYTGTLEWKQSGAGVPGIVYRASV